MRLFRALFHEKPKDVQRIEVDEFTSSCHECGLHICPIIGDGTKTLQPHALQKLLHALWDSPSQKIDLRKSKMSCSGQLLEMACSGGLGYCSTEAVGAVMKKWHDDRMLAQGKYPEVLVVGDLRYDIYTGFNSDGFPPLGFVDIRLKDSFSDWVTENVNFCPYSESLQNKCFASLRSYD